MPVSPDQPPTGSSYSNVAIALLVLSVLGYGPATDAELPLCPAPATGSETVGFTSDTAADGR